jgi:hypothetical protein
MRHVQAQATWPAYAEPGNALNQQKPKHKGFELGHVAGDSGAVYELAVAALTQSEIVFCLRPQYRLRCGVVAEGGCHGSGPQMD